MTPARRSLNRFGLTSNSSVPLPASPLYFNNDTNQTPVVGENEACQGLLFQRNGYLSAFSLHRNTLAEVNAESHLGLRVQCLEIITRYDQERKGEQQKDTFHRAQRVEMLRGTGTKRHKNVLCCYPICFVGDFCIITSFEASIFRSGDIISICLRTLDLTERTWSIDVLSICAISLLE